jgi:hypothetical protein
VDGNLNSVGTTAGFRESNLNQGAISVRLPRGANQQRFYPVRQNGASPEDLTDPNVTQAWNIFGWSNVQSLIYQVSVSYTIVLRGPIHNVNGGIPEIARSLAANTFTPRGILTYDVLHAQESESDD